MTPLRSISVFHAAARAGSVSRATQEARGFRSVTTLVVRGTPTLLSKWLLPRLGSFLDLHPDMHVRVDATTEHTDFAREAVDLEIRHGDGRYPGLYSEGFAEERFWPVCAPSLISPASLAMADVPEHRMIHSLKSQMQWARWFAISQVPGEGKRRVLFDRSHMAIDAAVGGLGIALESDLMTWKELRDGTLTCPVRDPPAVSLTTQWIVCTQQAVQQRKVRLFLAWLRAQRDEWQAAARPGPP